MDGDGVGLEEGGTVATVSAIGPGPDDSREVYKDKVTGRAVPPHRTKQEWYQPAVGMSSTV